MPSLLHQAQVLLNAYKDDLVASIPDDALGWMALGCAYSDWETGAALFRRLFAAQEPCGLLLGADKTATYPIQGFLLAGLYELAPDEGSAIRFLKEWYPKIVNFHRYLYHHRDPEEEGLLTITYPGEYLLPASRIHAPAAEAANGANLTIQDPLFNACLVWSNECLMEIGAALGADVSEILLWNELTIFSFNDKLWDEDSGLYRPYDMTSRSWLPADPIAGVLPLIGEIPDQDQAELMLENWKKAQSGPPAGKQDSAELPAISIIANWLLYHGLWRFGMRAAADQLRRQSLELVEQHGFLAGYPPAAASAGDSPGPPFLPAAALCAAWLMEE